MTELDNQYVMDLEDGENEEGFCDFVLVPQGEYTSVLQPFKLKEAISTFTKTNGDGSTKTFTTFQVPFSITFLVDPEDEESVMTVNVPYKIFLDLKTSAEGKIQFNWQAGKNRQLALLRQALNQNKEGWRVYDLIGQTAIVTIGHRAYLDKTTGEPRFQAEIIRVAATTSSRAESV